MPECCPIEKHLFSFVYVRDKYLPEYSVGNRNPHFQKFINKWTKILCNVTKLLTKFRFFIIGQYPLLPRSELLDITLQVRHNSRTLRETRGSDKLNLTCPICSLVVLPVGLYNSKDISKNVAWTFLLSLTCHSSLSKDHNPP